MKWQQEEEDLQQAQHHVEEEDLQQEQQEEENLQQAQHHVEEGEDKFSLYLFNNYFCLIFLRIFLQCR